MKATFRFIFAILFCCTLTARAALPKSEYPNVILIYTDDQGYGDVSALNPESKFKTPNLDRLVREGTTLTDGHCSDTVCTPSRYGLLTGRYSWRTHLKKGVFGAQRECLIEDGRLTLASLLRDAGYNTAMVGKWHLGMEFDGELGKRDWTKPFHDGPIEKGFDYFFGIPASMNYGVLTYQENDRLLKPATLWTAKKPGKVVHDRASYRIMPPYENSKPKKGQPLEVAEDFIDEQVLEKFTEKAIAWMEKVAPDAQQGKPFFLYWPLTSPHKPVCPLPRFEGKSQAGAYGDFMVETDHWVGEIMKAVKRLGLDDNTMIVFTSDNGPEKTYAERINVYQHRSAGIFRGGKRDLYEGGHRVPFMIRWPAKIGPGGTIDTPVCQTDLLATFADMVGRRLPANAGEDSESFWPALIGDRRDDTTRGPMIHHSASGQFAIRDGDWKLNLGRGNQGNRPDSDNTGPYELYNLANDPSEKKNVYRENKQIANRLRNKLTRLIQNGRSTPGPPQANDGRWWPQLTWIPAPDGTPTPKPRNRRKKQ